MDKAYSSWKSGEQSSANALDQALVNTFGRMVDPGATVREAEYQRTPENMSAVNRFDALWGRLSKGGVLNDAEREDLMRVAKILGGARGKRYNETLSEYENLATQYGVEPSMVTRGMKPYEGAVTKSVTVDGNVVVPKEKESTIEAYLNKNPNKTREDIIRAMKKQGAL